LEHPSLRQLATRRAASAPDVLDADALAARCRDLGADDVGFVELDDPALASQREEIRAAFPDARAVVVFVLRMNRANVRSPRRSAANVEFHHATDGVVDVASRLARSLEAEGVGAYYQAPGFPMEMDRFPSKAWVMSYKPLAEAAGLGRMGIHRNVIHPQFGNFVLIGAVAVDRPISAYGRPLDFNPCFSCKLCVAACPVGAIEPDGGFRFTACLTHNYREFMGGFADWAETLADAPDAKAYRERVTPAESASMWQSLSFGANYKAAYCMAVCPAGEDVIGAYTTDKAGFVKKVLRPLQEATEPIYVVAGSDAEAHVRKRFPHKPVRLVRNGARPTTIPGFLASLRLAFQPGAAAGLAAVYHFTFTGAEPITATVTIRDGKLTVADGHVDVPDLRVVANAAWWLRFVTGDARLLGGLVRGKLRVRGPVRLLAAFGRCFR
jgi:ferredoxin